MTSFDVISRKHYIRASCYINRSQAKKVFPKVFLFLRVYTRNSFYNYGYCLPKRKSKRRNKVGPMPTVPVKERKKEKQISELLSGSNTSINRAFFEEELTMVQAFDASDEETTSIKTFIMQPVESALDEVKAEATVSVKKAVSFQINFVQRMHRMPSRLAERLETKPEVVKSQQQVVFTDEDEALMDAILAESEADEKMRALEEEQKAAELLREEKLKAIREKAKVMQSRPPTRAGREVVGECKRG